jgi:hypothetical protein
MVGDRRPDELGLRVLEAERRVEEVLVVRESAFVPDLRLDVVADAGLEPLS